MIRSEYEANKQMMDYAAWSQTEPMVYEISAPGGHEDPYSRTLFVAVTLAGSLLGVAAAGLICFFITG